MSNIEPNIIDPTRPQPTPDGVPPQIDPDENDLSEPDDIREPDSDVPPIEPDPEEVTQDVPPLRT